MAEAKKIHSLVIADDDQVRVRYYHYLFDREAPFLKVTGEAFNGQEALDLCEKTGPDILLLDLQMPVVSGFEVLQKLKSVPGLKTKILVMTNYDFCRAGVLSLGADMFLLKDTTDKDLLAKLEELAAKEIAPEGQVEGNHENIPDLKDKGFYGLSEKELRLLNLLAKAGVTREQIGIELGLTPRTVNNYVGILYAKLGVNKEKDAIAFARRNGLLS